MMPSWRVCAVLLLAVTAGACSVAGGPAMSFRLASFQEGAKCEGDDCATVIVAEGHITRETPAAFAGFVEQVSDKTPIRNVVLLSSPGGHVGGSLALGLMLRSLGSTVMIAKADADTQGLIRQLYPANCYSACAYTLMGARKRVLPSGSEIGVHRMHGYGGAVDPAREAQTSGRSPATVSDVSVLKTYVRSVGVDPKVVDLAETVPSDRIHVLSTSELRRYRMRVDKPF